MPVFIKARHSDEPSAFETRACVTNVPPMSLCPAVLTVRIRLRMNVVIGVIAVSMPICGPAAAPVCA